MSIAGGNIENKVSTETNSLSVSKQIDWSLHPKVTGPQYIPEQVSLSWSNYLGWNTSGVLRKWCLCNNIEVLIFVSSFWISKRYSIIKIHKGKPSNKMLSNKVPIGFYYR